MAQLGYLITVTELRLDAENFKKSTGEAWSTYEKRIKKFYNQTIPPDPGPSPIPSNRPPDQSSPTSCCCNLAIELGVRGPGPWTHTHVHRYTVRIPCTMCRVVTGTGHMRYSAISKLHVAPLLYRWACA